MWKYPTQRIDQATDKTAEAFTAYQNTVNKVYKADIFLLDGVR